MAGSANFDWKIRQILIVDRDDHFRFWARGLFKQQRAAEVQSVGHAADAKALLRQGSADIALVELGDDPGEFLCFLNWLRDGSASPCPGLPVLAVTKGAGTEYVWQATSVGIHGLLKKPVSGREMLDLTAATLRKPRLLPCVAAARAKQEGIGDRPTPVPRPAPTAERSSEPARKTAMTPSPRGSGSVVLRTASVRKGGGAGIAASPLPATGSASLIEVVEPAGTARRGSQAIEVAGPDPVATTGSEPLEIIGAPAPSADAGWGDPARNTKDSKSKAAEFVDLPKERRRAPAATPEALDLDAALAAHQQWVESGGGAGQRADLHGEDLSGCDLNGAQLTSAVLRHADLSGCDLAGAQLQGADLRQAEMFGAKLSGANLAVARLRHARLRGCLLDDANLKGADLAGADLGGSTLGAANLAGANLLGVDLSGTDLAGVSGLTQGQLESVRGDVDTRLPPGLRLPAAPVGG